MRETCEKRARPRARRLTVRFPRWAASLLSKKQTKKTALLEGNITAQKGESAIMAKIRVSPPAPPAQQIDMFTGALVDTRSRAQKRKARQLQAARLQPCMFSQRELAQPYRKTYFIIPDRSPLGLYLQDARSEAEKEADRQREIAARHVGDLFE